MGTTRQDLAAGRALNQFLASPGVMDLINAMMARLDDTEDVLLKLRDFRGIDTATGVWLDIIGDIVGIERPSKEQPYGTIFAFHGGDGDEIDDHYKGFYNPAGS